MRRLLEFKAIVLVLALAGLAGLGVLASALREAKFQPAGPLPFSFEQQRSEMGVTAPLDLPFLYLVLLAILFLMLIGLLWAVLNPKTRKRALLALLRLALTVAVLFWLSELSGVELPTTMELTAGPPAEGGSVSFEQENAEFVQPEVNPWLVFVVSFGVALGLVALAWALASRRGRLGRSQPLQNLAGIARRALYGLQDGRDWDDAIIQAYVHMTEVVTAERGLIRQPWTTPLEFAVRLEQMGLPGEAARTLTRLFEQVRYGGQTSTRQDRDLAAAALNAIVRACGQDGRSA